MVIFETKSRRKYANGPNDGLTDELSSVSFEFYSESKNLEEVGPRVQAHREP